TKQQQPNDPNSNRSHPYALCFSPPVKSQERTFKQSKMWTDREIAAVPNQMTPLPHLPTYATRPNNTSEQIALQIRQIQRKAASSFFSCSAHTHPVPSFHFVRNPHPSTAGLGKWERNSNFA
ncbi:hypothetical protein AABB24_031977, partial [Solanum stoloniferum]